MGTPLLAPRIRRSRQAPRPRPLRSPPSISAVTTMQVSGDSWAEPSCSPDAGSSYPRLGLRTCPCHPAGGYGRRSRVGCAEKRARTRLVGASQTGSACATSVTAIRAMRGRSRTKPSLTLHRGSERRCRERGGSVVAPIGWLGRARAGCLRCRRRMRRARLCLCSGSCWVRRRSGRLLRGRPGRSFRT